MALNKLDKSGKESSGDKKSATKKSSTERSSDQGRKTASGGSTKSNKKNQQKGE